jgi:uncharacterized protein (DUF1800 family)
MKQVDPAWAWAPFSPQDDRPWDVGLAAHLHRRAGFGADWPRIQQAVSLGPAAAVDQLFVSATSAKTPELDAFDQQMGQLASTMADRGDPRQLSAWWLYRMIHTADPLIEQATLFWHNHFATSGAKVADPKLMLAQHDLLRTHALGSFEAMVHGISRDPAMLIWLDSTTNRRIRPNENYARELMELFCLGVGNYTETDIKEVARAFTGWELRGTRFTFNKYQHDEGQKTFLGHTGNFNGDDAVRIVLDQPAEPRFIATKLVRYFVAEDPQVSLELVEPIARQLREHEFQIGPVLRTILSSNIFYSPRAIGRRVRSPVELGVGLMRSLEMTGSTQQLAGALDHLGQALFFPPNVKGWDGGRTWISSATLLGRANVVRDLLLGRQARFVGPDLAEQSQRDGATDPASSVERLLKLLVAVPVPAETRSSLVAMAESEAADTNHRLARVVCAIAALPEFHLC